MEKRKHHFISAAYLRSFSDTEGKLFAYSKEKEGDFIHVKPEEIAFRNYYYSQPMPDGRRDNNALEDLFGSVESCWTPFVNDVRRRKNLNSHLEDLVQFMCMHRVRVPTARDAAERMLAETVRATANLLDKQGRLPPKPVGHEDILEKMSISIDPHQSIHAMAHVAKGLATMFDAVGLEILVNDSDIGFLTSDNPLIYFDPCLSEAKVQPYQIDPLTLKIELLFPITPRHLIRGMTELKSRFSMRGLEYREFQDREQVKRINRLVAKFADTWVFSDSRYHHPLIKRHAAKSPIVTFEHIPTDRGNLMIASSTFGSRQKKPKWRE